MKIGEYYTKGGYKAIIESINYNKKYPLIGKLFLLNGKKIIKTAWTEEGKYNPSVPEITEFDLAIKI